MDWRMVVSVNMDVNKPIVTILRRIPIKNETNILDESFLKRCRLVVITDLSDELFLYQSIGIGNGLAAVAIFADESSDLTQIPV